MDPRVLELAIVPALLVSGTIIVGIGRTWVALINEKVDRNDHVRWPFEKLLPLQGRWLCYFLCTPLLLVLWWVLLVFSLGVMANLIMCVRMLLSHPKLLFPAG